jgi:predicted glycoside hydrolase/deacetylase ChbG (UPF0249 family)
VRQIRVIINADDLGITREVNRATFDRMKSGQITSATLLANAPYVEEACERAAQFPDCSFGAHLNLTEFRPLTGQDGLGYLLDDKGSFTENPIRKISINSALSNAIYEEFCAQIERIQSLGVTVSHIDSHKHIHTLPRVFPILKRVQKRFNIRRVRATRNMYAAHEAVSKSLLARKIIYNFLLRHYYKTVTTQGFTDLTTFLERGRVGRIKYKNVEIMVHVGSQSYYEDDSDLLDQQWQEIQDFPVRLISYYEL